MTEAKKSTGLREGDAAPSFELPGAGGERLALSGFSGKKLVLYFYPKDDTSGCTKEAIEFNALRSRFRARRRPRSSASRRIRRPSTTNSAPNTS